MSHFPATAPYTLGSTLQKFLFLTNRLQRMHVIKYRVALNKFYARIFSTRNIFITYLMLLTQIHIQLYMVQPFYEKDESDLFFQTIVNHNFDLIFLSKSILRPNGVKLGQN